MTILTAQREQFAQHYAVHRSGPAAYRHAYNVKATTKQSAVDSGACRLLCDDQIKARIDELIFAETPALPAVMDLNQIAARWAAMATASPDELIGVRVGNCRYCHGEGNLYQWKEREYLAAMAEAERMQQTDANYPYPDIAGGFGFRKGTAPNPDCPECEGEGVERVVPRDTSKLSPGAALLYGGVKQGRNGVEIIIADRGKAFENLTRMRGGFTDRVKLDGSLQTMAAVVKLETTDPQEAARLYQKMIAGTLAVK